MKKSEFLQKIYDAVKLYGQICSDRREKTRNNETERYKVSLEALSAVGFKLDDSQKQSNPIPCAVMLISQYELSSSCLLTLIQAEIAWEYHCSFSM